MLSQRVVTAALLLPLAVLAVLFLPTRWLGLLAAVPVLLGGWEWARLAGVRRTAGRVACLLLLSLALWLVWGHGAGRGAVAVAVSGAAVLWWAVAFVLVLAYRGRERSNAGWAVGLRAASGVAVLVPAWLALVVVHGSTADGPALILFALVLVWLGDIAAYVVGRRWGRHPLIPKVSPGKTREGLWGELVAAFAWAVLGAWWFGFNEAWESVVFAGVAIAGVGASVIGDLYVSLVKRGAHAKDSGNLLPGHGGIMDRIDSLTAALPVLFLGLRSVGAT